METEDRELLEGTLNGCKSMTRIIDELLQYTRVAPLKPQPTELDRWLGQVLDELQARRPDAQLERELQAAQGETPVRQIRVTTSKGL